MSILLIGYLQGIILLKALLDRSVLGRGKLAAVLAKELKKPDNKKLKQQAIRKQVCCQQKLLPPARNRCEWKARSQTQPVILFACLSNYDKRVENVSPTGKLVKAAFEAYLMRITLSERAAMLVAVGNALTAERELARRYGFIKREAACLLPLRQGATR